MNIIKQTLIEKKEATAKQIHALLIERQIAFESRGAELLKPALEIYPEANLVYQYDSFQVRTGSKYSDLISINNRGYHGEAPSYYLSTYSTTIDTEFELKRLILNGRIAEMFLNDSDLGAKMFEGTDLCLQLGDLRDESRALDRAIYEMEVQEKVDKLADAVKRFESGDEIEFSKHVNFTFGHKRHDTVVRVIKIKLINTPKKGVVNVEVTCKGWNTDEPHIQTLNNIKMKYVTGFLHENLAKMPA
jgi:hypothetical protein